MATIDVALVVAFLTLSLLLVAFRGPLRYRNDPLLLLLLGLVLLLELAAKALTHVDYFRRLALPYFLVYLELAIGFAVGPTMLLVAATDRPSRLRRAVLFLPCLLPLLLFGRYASLPFPLQEARVLGILNGEDRLYNLLGVALLVVVGACLVGSTASLWPRRPLRPAAVAAGYLAALSGSLALSPSTVGLQPFVFPAIAAVCCALAGTSVVVVLCPNALARQELAQRERRLAVAAKVARYFVEQKPYLRKHLSLSDVAKALGLPRGELSAVVNSGFGKSFTHFVNEYRVEEAKRRLADPASRHVKVEFVGYECGFSSKGSFFSIFKAFTGHTPHSFRNGGPPVDRSGAARPLQILAVFVPVAIASLALSATCTGRAHSGRWLSGPYRSQTPFDGAVSRMVLRSDGSLAVSWFSYNGAHAGPTPGTYELSDGRLRFEAKGLADDGEPELDPKDRIAYVVRGELAWDAELRRWTGPVWTGMPGWEMEDTAQFSLTEGVDLALMLREVLRRRVFVFWAACLFLFASWRRWARSEPRDLPVPSPASAATPTGDSC